MSKKEKTILYAICAVIVCAVVAVGVTQNTTGSREKEMKKLLANNWYRQWSESVSFTLYDDGTVTIPGSYGETVKAEMNGLTPGLDRSPPPRWMGGQGGQSLKVFGRTRSFWGLSSPKIEMGGKALKWLSRLDYPLAKTGETVNGGAESAVHLDR